MPVEELIREEVTETTTETTTESAPPVFGRCPICGKPLYPRDKHTGRPQAPKVGAGAESRARCDSCGTIIEYMGDGKWVPVGRDHDADEIDDTVRRLVE